MAKKEVDLYKKSVRESYLMVAFLIIGLTYVFIAPTIFENVASLFAQIVTWIIAGAIAIGVYKMTFD